MKDKYVHIYNILIVLITNIDFRLYNQQVKTDGSLKKVFELFQDIMYLYDKSPFETHFNKMYLFE